MSEKVFLSLGSNLGNREENIIKAFEMLSLTNKKMSSFYESEAMLHKDMPEEWAINYINTAVSGYTDIPIFDLIDELINIELALGREEGEKWSPRIIDIDIVFWGNKIINEGNLVIPHVGACKRDFVLEPICEIDPNALHPEYGMSVAELLKRLNLKKHVTNVYNNAQYLHTLV